MATGSRLRVVRPRKRARVIDREIMFTGKVFDVTRETIIEPSGVRATRDYVVHPGSVVVLPVLVDGRIVLIRQYRHAAGASLWELVAGRKDEGESFEEGARRELREETGYTARRVRRLIELFPSPGFVMEKMVIFLAEGLTKGAAQPEEDERIETRILKLREAERWIRTGKIHDAKTAAGILYYSKFVARRGKR
ncbi:MAG: NUDIX hydrolase [Candidatus Acidiferrales bacterium]